MKIILFALFLVLLSLLLVAASRLIEGMAYERGCRYLHIRTIIALFLVLLAVTNVYTVSWIITIVDWVINNPVLAPVFNLFMPNRAYALVYMLLMFIMLNILVAVVALVTIAVVKLVFSGKRKYLDYDECVGFARVIHFPWYIVKKFYKSDNDKVLLSSKGFSFGKWVKGLKWVFALLWIAQVAALAASILWGKTEWNDLLLTISKAWYLLPMASFFMLQQIQFFLEGEFYDEAGGFSSPKISKQLLEQMKELMGFYCHHFGDSGVLLLADYYEDKCDERSEPGMQGNSLGNSQIHDCKEREILEAVANHIKQSGIHMNSTCENALVELLNGESINICDHCEGEFLVYLCSYLNFFLSQGKTVLVLCPTRERSQVISAAIEQAMNKLNNLCSVWNVSRLEEASDSCRINILVCTADEFVQNNVAGRRQEFTKDLFCTVLVDGFELFSQDCIRNNQVFGVLRDMKWMEQYVLFTEGNNDDLRTAAELATGKEFCPFSHDTLCPKTGVMVWGEESAFRIQRQIGVGSQISPYMGTAIPLAILAAKYDMDKVHIVQEPSRADHSYWDVLSEVRTEVLSFMRKSANLQSMIRTDNSEILNDPGDKVVVLYDTEHNFYHALWEWVKYSGKTATLIHIISPSYLLREYFVAKYRADRTPVKNNEFDSLVSYHQGMEATRMALLLAKLCKEDMTERELMAKSREYGWKYDNAVELLRDCLRVVLTENEIHSVYSSFQFKRRKGFVPAKSTFEPETYVSLTDDVIRKRLDDKVKLARLVSQNHQQTALPILAGNIYNYYLRDQVVPINGYFYQIGMISDGNVYAEQKNHSDAAEYMQLCDFEFSDYERLDACVDTEHLDFNICTANIKRRIYGYWETTNGNRFGESTGSMLHDLRGDGDGIVAQYKNAGILEINISKSVLGGKAVETARLLAYTLKEFFRTLFPHSYQNLFVAIREEDGSSYAKEVFRSAQHNVEQMAASLIPTVAPGFDTPDSDCITVFVVEASCLEYGMVKMLYERRMDVFRMLREYLSWYQSSREDMNAWEERERAREAKKAEAAELVVPEEATAPAEAGDSASGTEGEPVAPVAPEDTAAPAEPGESTDGAEKQIIPEEQDPKPDCGTYLHFGSDHIPDVFSLEGLLTLCDKIAPITVVPNAEVKCDVYPENVRVCSFCGAPTIMPNELEEGKVRRLMCSDCAEHQCAAEDEVNVLYSGVFDSMERDYKIKLPENLMVRFQTATAIYKATGVGGTGGGRVLGFYHHAGKQLWLESRGPEVALRSTIFHELTHAWQYYDRGFSDTLKLVLHKFKRKYRPIVRLLLVEGHAMYTEIDGMWEHHERVYADRLRRITENRPDEYGIGYCFVREYLEEYRTGGSHVTPFVAMRHLLDEIVEGKEPKDKLLILVQQIMENKGT